MDFEDLKDTAKGLADKAVSKTGELVEISKLKLELSKQTGLLRALYEKLGSSVYSMKEKDYNDPELVAHLCEEISDALQKQKDLKAQVASLKKMSFCPFCGARNPKDSTFCNHCGSRIQKDFADESADEACAEEPAQEAFNADLDETDETDA